MSETQTSPSAATQPGTGRALIIHPVLDKPGGDHARSVEGRLAEAAGLARAIDLEVVGGEAVRLKTIRPATLLGDGQVARIGELVEAQAASLVVVDAAVTPIQQRNLEKAWKVKVIDRTGLILEIFGARARTREGQMQVELAALTYQRSRLVRSWTHLERQRGGFGFLGGPGESQLEMDRRLIGDRITKLKRELEEVKRTRGLHRAARQRVPYPIVALVGYTNAGKSTLFNRLTRASVRAEDLLFATLDPTMRGIDLPSGRRIILSDTVGFVSDLPHQLVAAFRATLEEVMAADIVLHVRDIAHPDSEAQRQDVETVLSDLGLADTVDAGLLEVWNKMDLLDPDAAAAMVEQSRRNPDMLPVSALTGAGAETLLARLDAILALALTPLWIELDLTEGRALAWLYEHGDVRARCDDDRHARLEVGLTPANLVRFSRMFPGIHTEPAGAIPAP